jgi:hypothetical protein
MADPGKFEGNEDQDVAEILYDATLNGMVDEEAGDVQEHGMWSGIFRGVEVEDGELKDGASGGYIVQEDEQGFFTYAEYDTDEELNEEWDRILATYEEMDEESGEDDEDEEGGGADEDDISLL